MKTHEKHVHEPFVRVVKRDAMPFWKAMLIRIVAVGLGLGTCLLLCLILVKNFDVGKLLKTFFEGVFGPFQDVQELWRNCIELIKEMGMKIIAHFENTMESNLWESLWGAVTEVGVHLIALFEVITKSNLWENMWELFKNAAMLLCISLAVTPAFRMKFWNIGAEGQTLIGALAATAIAYYFGGQIPEPLLLVLMLISAVLIGAIWGFLPAVFKAKWNTNETLFTLMMNYVATGLVAFFLAIWVPKSGSVLGMLNYGFFPQVFHKYFLVVLIALVMAVLLYVYLNYTKHGYEISVVGESENTARYVGINVSKVIIRTMIVSGAICGMVGFLFVSAVDHSVTETTVGGMGFTAIMVSWLSKFNPLVMVGISAFISFLKQGSAEIGSAIDPSFPDIIVGTILLFIIGCEFFIGYQLKFRKISRKGGKAS